ncbi:MAG: Bcr/CflA family drug resistance efflux transporter [Prosthecochloris sp.]|nr:Bcr/CflA family drug resistance efflux transporter [Prosthecochloris sp.]
MSGKSGRSTVKFAESVALIAMMMSLAALSIDAMLPALPAIGHELGVLQENTNQLVISLLFLGMSAGQILYGPMSDSAGRKPAIYTGFGIFITGTLFCLFATSFTMMLSGRILQGVGAASTRIVSIAIVRDQYEGPKMARVMSFVMTIFILIPILAPALGQTMLNASGWRAIFGILLFLSLFTLAWFSLRQPETLSREKRIPFTIKRIAAAIREVLGIRQSLAYTIISGLVFGSFLGYLNSSQQILQIQYGLGEDFPLYFGILAAAFGAATLLNSKLVMLFRMHSLVHHAMQALAVLSGLFLVTAMTQHGHPPLWAFLIYLLPVFFTIGILFGNLNTLAMEPLGHIAGIGASTIGSLSTFIALSVGTVIGQSYNGTVLPLIAGFLILSVLSLGVMRWMGLESGLALSRDQ